MSPFDTGGLTCYVQLIQCINFSMSSTNRIYYKRNWFSPRHSPELLSICFQYCERVFLIWVYCARRHSKNFPYFLTFLATYPVDNQYWFLNFPAFFTWINLALNMISLFCITLTI